jgi:nucleotide-binding universal stress UspA family protein
MSPISHILCAIDFSEESRPALAQAAAFARSHGAALTLLHVFVDRPVVESPPTVLTDQDRTRLAARLREFAAATTPDLPADFRVRQAVFAHEAILEAIDDIDADLLVMGTHGRSGFRHLLMGSVTEKVIRRAPCPTLIVPPAAAGGGTPELIARRQILCAVDFSPGSLAALAQALNVAQETGARLLVVHAVELPPVVPDIPPAANLSAVAAQLEADARRRLYDLIPEAARAYCTVEIAVVEGRAHREILRTATDRKADLIVMGVQGRDALDLLLFGSTTHHVLRAAPCPVLVVHSEDGAAAWRRYRDGREQALVGPRSAHAGHPAVD